MNIQSEGSAKHVCMMQGILGELNTQRETMFGIRSNLHEVDDHISRGRQTLAIMSRRVFTNKAIMCVIIAALAGAIILVVVSDLLLYRIVRKL